MSMCTFYRGRLTFQELANSEIRYIQTLRYTMIETLKTKEGKDQQAAEMVEDELMG